MSTPRRWAHTQRDQHAHLLTKPNPHHIEPAQIGVIVGVCGRVLPWSVPTSTQPTRAPCPTCQALADRPSPGDGGGGAR